ncbi:MAG: acylphosphatase [Methylococcaceae bacterium]|nr:acylphosphatase [Methylococcaceae bacterium]
MIVLIMGKAGKGERELQLYKAKFIIPLNQSTDSVINKVNLNIRVSGFVQGVGFRPFVSRLAKLHFQNGWVANTTDGVCISIEGLPDNQTQFLHDLKNRLPPFAEIQSLSVSQEPLTDYVGFQIQASIIDSKRSTFLLPDIATCPDCLNDLFDRSSRFYRYPFTSCCNCGPRYSIIHSQPFDRVRTSMMEFKPCDECEADYGSIENRRFHAQTIACPKCGPQLHL